MQCRRAKKLICIRMDGELAGPEERLLQEHLEHCLDCRSLAGDLAALADPLSQLEAPEPRWGFADRLLARTDAAPRVTSRDWRAVLTPIRLGLAAAGFAFGVVLTLAAGDSADVATIQVSQTTQSADDDYLAELTPDPLDDTLLAMLTDTED